MNDRANFYYDPARQGYDTTLWKTITGTPTIASSKMRLNTAEILGYGDLFKAESTFKVNVPVAPVSATLVSGASVETNPVTWAAVSDGEFAITIDGTAESVTPIDFSTVTKMADVAALIQAAIRVETENTETVVWESTLTGGTTASAFTVFEAVADGEFAITIDGTAYDITGIDFTGITSNAEAAALIETAIRTATSGTETCVFDTDHFVITAANSITVASAVAAGAGTDISGAGATTYLDCETAVGTALNALTITSTSAITVASAIDSGTGTDISGAGVGAFLDSDTGHGTATQGSDREFGLEQPGLNAKLTFKITGANLTCECLYDSVSNSTSVTWETAWTATDTSFTIKWTGFSAEFLINDIQRAFVTDLSVPKKALSQVIRNTGADNMDVAYIQTNNVQGYI